MNAVAHPAPRQLAAGALLALAAVPLLWTAVEALKTGSTTAAWRACPRAPGRPRCAHMWPRAGIPPG